jgi:hypothetical protein
MMARQPRTGIGTCGTVTVRRRDGRAIAETRIRDADGRIRQVRVRARTADQARTLLKQRMVAGVGPRIPGTTRLCAGQTSPG